MVRAKTKQADAMQKSAKTSKHRKRKGEEILFYRSNLKLPHPLQQRRYVVMFGKSNFTRRTTESLQSTCQMKRDHFFANVLSAIPVKRTLEMAKGVEVPAAAGNIS